jgi:Mlc titration factor MtfA (ptsG expression regulator)
MRFNKYLLLILERLKNPELQRRLLELEFFRGYAYTNQFEFMAVLAEHVFETPVDFKRELPEIYGYMLKILNLKEEWLFKAA